MFVGISDEWDALFVSKLFIFFSTSVRDTVLKVKTKIAFFENCFDNWMILVFRYCG